MHIGAGPERRRARCEQRALIEQTRRPRGHAVAHPELIVVAMQSAASDWAAARLAAAIERVAEALLVEEESTSGRPEVLVPPHELLQPRP